MKHRVTRDEAAALRRIASGDDSLADRLSEDGRIFRPPGLDSMIAVVAASGRSGCRECGETISAGDDAVVFGFDALASVGQWARLARAYIHAAPCVAYPEED